MVLPVNFKSTWFLTFLLENLGNCYHVGTYYLGWPESMVLRSGHLYLAREYITLFPKEKFQAW